MSDDPVILATRRWVDTVVIGLGLCPFAEDSISQGRFRMSVCTTRDLQVLCKAVIDELLFMQANEGQQLDSVLLIHPHALPDFEQYNDFLDVCQQLLEDLSLVGEFQIASFHPQYRFEGSAVDDVGNYTNRSPYPMLHLLRESSVARAGSEHPDPKSIPEQNVRRLESLGVAAVEAMLDACRTLERDSGSA
jgi:hypothetical protein